MSGMPELPAFTVARCAVELSSSRSADFRLMRVAVLQSNYIPWKGYFDIIHDVDLFVFYDDVQYTKNDWRNRNRIKTANARLPMANRSNRTRYR